jgi:hypothetical protein
MSGMASSTLALCFSISVASGVFDGEGFSTIPAQDENKNNTKKYVRILFIKPLSPGDYHLLSEF